MKLSRRAFRNLNTEQRREFFAREVVGKKLFRDFTLSREGINEEQRTVDLAFSSDTPYERWWCTEILSHDAKAILLKRLNDGGALLSDHDARRQIGAVVSGTAKTDGHVARCTAKFSTRDAAEEEFQDVLAGIRTKVSVGYVILKYEFDEKTETLTATQWEPLEVSLVAIPADTTVGVGRAKDDTTDEETKCDCGDPDCEDPECDGEPAEEASKSKGRSPKTTSQKNQIHPAQTSRSNAAERGKATTRTTMRLKTNRKLKFQNCAEGTEACDDTRCETHYEDDGSERATDQPQSADAQRATQFVEFGRIYGEEELALDYAADETKSLKDLKTEILARRKAKAAATTPAAEEPGTAASRNGGGSNVIQFAYASKPRHFKGATTEEAAEKAYRMGMWFRGALLNDPKAVAFCKENGIPLQRAQQETVNEKGGFLVPPEFGNDMIDLRELYGVARRLFKVLPMAAETRSDPRRVGGLTAFFVAESGPGTISDKTWDRVGLTARKLMCLSRLSSEINEDSTVALGDDLAGEMAYAFASKEDDCGINGDGSSTYGTITGLRQAFKNLSGTIANIAGLVVSTGTGYATSYDSIVLKDFSKVKGKLPQYALARGPRWLMHQSFWSGVVEPLVLAAGGVTAMEIAAGMPPRLLGYPVEISQQMPNVSAVSQVVCFFGVYDLAVTFGDRRSTTIALSEHSRFANDEIEIRGTERFDINVHDVGNASASAGSRVPGPVVGLITAAS